MLPVGLRGLGDQERLARRPAQIHASAERPSSKAEAPGSGTALIEYANVSEFGGLPALAANSKPP